MAILFSDRSLPRESKRVLLGAFAGALLLEAAAIGGLTVWLSDRVLPPAADKPAMQISLVALPPAPKPPEPVMEPPKPEPPPPPKPEPPPPPKVEPPPEPPPPQPVPQPKPPPPRPTPKPVVRVPKIVKPLAPPQPVSEPMVQYPTTPEVPRPILPVQSAALSPNALASFESHIRQAIQAANIYPPAAEMMKQRGRVRIEFDYVDGQASNIRIVQPSGFPLLDEAALAAARHAEYPSPPPELRGQTQHLSGWVEDEPKGAE